MTKIKLPARIENIRNGVQLVSNYAHHLGYSEKRLREIELAVEEALVNVCRYAYPAATGDVELRCSRKDIRKMTIEIKDWGPPFDPLAVPDPDLASDLRSRKTGGLGIFFIRRMVDEVYYRREGGRNLLTFVIYPAIPSVNEPEPTYRSTQKKKIA